MIRLNFSDREDTPPPQPSPASGGGLGWGLLLSPLVRLCAAVLILLGAAVSVLAVEPSERLADPVLEARARTLGEELRCLVCQNQSIDELNADLAHDLRVLLRQRLTAGDTDQQVLDYLVARYGMFVLLDPPFALVTSLLWLTPPALLIGGGLVLALRARRRRPEPETPELSRDEKVRAARLLGEPG